MKDTTLNSDYTKPKDRAKDGNDFTSEIEHTICKAGFNPDTFWRRPAYAQRCIDDMRNDIKIINNPQDEMSIRFEKAIKAIEKTIKPTNKNNETQT